MQEFLSNITTELIVGVILFLLGFLANEIWDKVTRNSKELNLRNKVRTALKIIYEAEEKFRGPKRGVEKLEYAVKKFMEELKINNYEKSQEFILKIFNLTNLSKIDINLSNNSNSS